MLCYDSSESERICQKLGWSKQTDVFFVLKTKVECYSDEVTDFHNKEVSKLGCNYIFLAVISLDCTLKKYQSYYLEVFLKEWN